MASRISFDMSIGKKITSNLKRGNALDTLGARELRGVSGFGQVFGSLAVASALLLRGGH